MPVPFAFLPEIGRVAICREAVRHTCQTILCLFGGSTYAVGQVLFEDLQLGRSLQMVRDLMEVLLSGKPEWEPLQRAPTEARAAVTAANGIVHAMWTDDAAQSSSRTRQKARKGAVGLKFEPTKTTLSDLQTLADRLWVANVDIWGAIGGLVIERARVPAIKVVP